MTVTAERRSDAELALTRTASALPIPAPPTREGLQEALLAISNLVGSNLDWPDVLAQICRTSARALGTDTCSLYMREDAVEDESPESRRLVLRATHGLRQSMVNRGAFHLGEGIPGWAAQHDQVVTVRDSREDERYLPLDDGPQENFVAYLCVPLRLRGEVIGVLSIRRLEPCDWTEQDIVFAEIISRQVAMVIDKARLLAARIDAERLGAMALSLSETAHSIKNMLQGMNGGAFMIEQGIKREDLQRIARGWTIMKNNQDKVQRLVLNMLSFSRTTALAFEEADLNALVERIVLEHRESAALENVQLSFVASPGLPKLRMDSGALADAILNLVRNAIDAIPEDRRGVVQVSIRTAERGAKPFAVVEIADNGTGIPEEAKAKLFRLFFTTKKTNGTGIGLCVTKKIIEEHGGRLTFTSAVGEGTTFRVELPLPR